MNSFSEIADFVESSLVGSYRPIDSIEPIWKNRSHFFMLNVKPLGRKGMPVFETQLRAQFDGTNIQVPANILKSTAKNTRPVTLDASLRLAYSLLRCTEGDGESAKMAASFFDEAGFDAKDAFSLPFLIESIYFAPSELIEKARKMKGIGRKKAAREVWNGNFRPDRHSNLFAHLEDEGKNKKQPKDCGYRITKFLAFRLFDVFEEQFQEIFQDEEEELEWSDVFMSSPTLGHGGGLQTVALARNNGNMLRPVTEEQQSYFFPKAEDDSASAV